MIKKSILFVAMLLVFIGRCWAEDGWNPDHPLNPGYYSVSAIANPQDFGVVTGAGLFEEGTDIVVTATPNSGYKFVKWNDGKKDNSYEFTLSEDTYLVARFAKEDEVPQETEVLSGETSATFIWPLIWGGHIYILIIYLDIEFTIPYCNLVFDEFGRLISNNFHEPSAHRNANEDGFTYTVTDLSPGKQYFYRMQTKDELGHLLNTDEGTFTTQKTPTSVGEIENDKMRKCENVKILRDGQLLILRDGKTYNAQGTRVE